MTRAFIVSFTPHAQVEIGVDGEGGACTFAPDAGDAAAVRVTKHDGQVAR